jgi:prephenate dehydrogenase
VKKTIFIIGLGLIGGSLALAVKETYPGAVIRGYDVNSRASRLADSLQVIDYAVSSIEEGVKDADIIILSAPVESSLSVLESLKSMDLKEGAVVTDVGSTKVSIVQKGRELQEKGVTFIGGHPMAGSHKTGVEASRSHLFENAFYILTPDKDTPASRLIQLQNLLKGTKARFIQIDAETHDRYAGMISHLPHIIAAALVHQLEKAGEKDPFVHQLAAGGFRDITRIASASPTMWRDILIHNRGPLLQMIGEWKSRMEEIETMVEDADTEEIFNFFEEAKAARDRLPSKKKGAMLPFYDLFVDIPDHPGVISDVTAILAEYAISITNIRIIEAREGIMGVLRLSFRSEEDLATAKNLLEEHMYETYESP